MSRAAALPGAELFSGYSCFFEEITCPGQLRCLGQNLFSEFRLFFLCNHHVHQTPNPIESTHNAPYRKHGTSHSEKLVWGPWGEARRRTMACRQFAAKGHELGKNVKALRPIHQTLSALSSPAPTSSAPDEYKSALPRDTFQRVCSQNKMSQPPEGS